MPWMLTRETHFETDAKAALHYLADALIRQVNASWMQYEHPQYLDYFHEHHLVASCIGSNKSCVSGGFGNVFNDNGCSFVIGI